MHFKNVVLQSFTILSCAIFFGTSVFGAGKDSDVMCSSTQPINFHRLPGVNEDSYTSLSDINIGGLALTLGGSKSPALSCSKKTLGVSYTSDTTEAIAFAVDLVNRNPDILPNVTLGFIIRGVCYNSPSVALATSLSFLPQTEQFSSSSSSGSHTDTIKNDNNHDRNDTSCSSQPQGQSSKWLSDDVIGVLSPDRDDLTTSISSLYSVAHLPIIGTTEVGDELSNKENHPYFFRTAPPQQWQIKAMLRFLSSNDWSYISIIYQEGHYGQNAFQSLDRNVAKYGICIATSHMLDYRTDYDAIVADLLKYPRARVVVLFMYGSTLRKVLRGVRNNNATGHFIFVAGDLVTTYSGFKYIGEPDDPAIGMFVFDLYFTYVMEFYEYLLKQKVSSTKNPWLRGAFEYIMECSYDTNQTKNRICEKDTNIYKTYRYRTNKATSLRIDAVLTLARAAHNLLQDRCPNAVGKSARECITGPLLREYLRNVSFDGYNGRIEFDENQDVKGKYVIGQFVYDYYNYPFTDYRRFKHMTLRHIGVFNALDDSISFYKDRPINWSHVKNLDRIIPRANTDTGPPDNLNTSTASPSSFPLTPDIPESVCSRPCIVGEYIIVKDVPCCWECRKCRDNEHLIHGNTSCEACPLHTWPDSDSGFTRCVDIPPTHPELDDTIQITLTSIAIICLIVLVIVFIAFIVYRDKKIIKASSRDLSIIQLISILIGYVTVILYQTTPTDLKCVVIFFMFCMSFALLYCTLLVKTIRIYRIFNLGLTTKKPWLISNASQVILSACLVMIQACLCTADFIYYGGAEAKLHQPIWTEKFVELSCVLTFPGLVSFLAYNLVQVVLCSIFAFKVRQLPDNFNESRFISMCVSTTLLIWLAFIPTYYTADRGNIRTFLLSTALLLNHSVALVFLFLPKIYAVNFIVPPNSSSTFVGSRLSREFSSSVHSGLESFNNAFTIN